MTTDAPTNVGKHVPSNGACSRNQRFTQFSFLICQRKTVVRYEVTLIPALCRTKRHVR